MKSYEYISAKVKERLGESRFKHSLRVEEKSIGLGSVYGLDLEKCRIAGIAHDVAKKLTDNEILSECRRYGIEIDSIQGKSPQLLHGHIGAAYCREEFQIEDQDILNAITYHTTGRKGMSMLEKVVFLADLIEDKRDFPGISDIRNAALVNLNEALVLSCNTTLIYVIQRNFLIHPLTVEFRNSLLLKDGK